MIRRLCAASLLLSLTAAAPPPRLERPVATGCISSPFGPRRLVGPRADRVHTGVDLPAAAGAWVHAAAAGRVVTIRRRGALGLEIDLRHPGGAVTRYAHLGTVAPALAGGRRQMKAGERIGRVGRSGVTYGTHLHFELRLDGRPVDPAPYLGLPLCR